MAAIVDLCEYRLSHRKAHTLIDGGAGITVALCQVLGDEFDGRVVS